MRAFRISTFGAWILGSLWSGPRTRRSPARFAGRLRGTAAQIDVLAQGAEPLPLTLQKRTRIHGMYAGSRRNFQLMNRAIAHAELRPVIEEFAWMRTSEALRRTQAGSPFGKLALTVN